MVTCAYLNAAGIGISMLGEVLKYVDERKQLKMFENYAYFAVDSTEMAEMLEKIARRLTLCNLSCDISAKETTLEKFTRVLNNGVTKVIEYSDKLIVPQSITASSRDQETSGINKATEDADKVASVITATVFAGDLRYKTKDEKIEQIVQHVRAHFDNMHR